MYNRTAPYFLLVFCLVLSPLFLISQRTTQYSQYMYNNMSINPAYAGSRMVLEVVATSRTQWVGIDGAPTTQNLTINLPTYDRLGLGVSILNERLGPVQALNFDLSLSYMFRLSYNANFSLGLSFGTSFVNANLSRLKRYQDVDNAIFDLDSELFPRIGIGLYLQTKKFYIGISMPELLKNGGFSINQSEGIELIDSETFSYYINAGFLFNLALLSRGRTIHGNPTLYFRRTYDGTTVTDLSFASIFNRKFLFSLGMRYTTLSDKNFISMIAIVGYQLSESTYLGFSFDKSQNDLGTFDLNSGTYEFLIKFSLDRLFKNNTLTPLRNF